MSQRCVPRASNCSCVAFFSFRIEEATGVHVSKRQRPANRQRCVPRASNCSCSAFLSFRAETTTGVYVSKRQRPANRQRCVPRASNCSCMALFSRSTISSRRSTSSLVNAPVSMLPCARALRCVLRRGCTQAAPHGDMMMADGTVKFDEHDLDRDHDQKRWRPIRSKYPRMALQSWSLRRVFRVFWERDAVGNARFVDDIRVDIHRYIRNICLYEKPVLHHIHVRIVSRAILLMSLVFANSLL